jgi:membrane-bound lytic murein transglycosylase A
MRFLSLFLLCGLLVGGFYVDKNHRLQAMASVQEDNTAVLGKNKKKKKKKAAILTSLYTLSRIDTIFSFPYIDRNLSYGLSYQSELLKRMGKQTFQLGKIKITTKELRSVANSLQAYSYQHPMSLGSLFDFYQIAGSDGKGSVKFTGYYTPTLSVSEDQSSDYPYPIFGHPKEDSPTILAYAQSEDDIHTLKLEGAGIAKYDNGERVMFNYAGKSQHRFYSFFNPSESDDMEEEELDDTDDSEEVNSAGTDVPMKETANEPAKKNTSTQDSIVVLENNSRAYFLKGTPRPIGAAELPLLAMYSVSVDPRYIPIGSCLLASLPITNEDGAVLRHEYAFLLAQDTGGAIHGKGRIDLYCGKGIRGKNKAKNLHHIGKVWLITPKKTKKNSISW